MSASKHISRHFLGRLRIRPTTSNPAPIAICFPIRHACASTNARIAHASPLPTHSRPAPISGRNDNNGVEHVSETILDERLYHKFADDTMDNLVEVLEELGELVDIDGYDVVFASGVLTLSLGSSGTYVINKQPPNKQIWLSSPVSGPKRFDWSASTEQWQCLRTNEVLEDMLSRELSSLLKREVDISSSL
ncbi:ferroxidase [Spizellomyces sp. 'palustris']|nr:ferroxidase [Spizellomyces sp. 'palustris']